VLDQSYSRARRGSGEFDDQPLRAQRAAERAAGEFSGGEFPFHAATDRMRIAADPLPASRSRESVTLTRGLPRWARNPGMKVSIIKDRPASFSAEL
jgi:hypothetical protein